MEPKNINELIANPKNPRTIDKHDFRALVESIKKFGDLSGIVLNTTTGQLVGGHQRVEAFKQLGGQPVITERFESPNSVGTIARGHVLLSDEKFSYREVVWDVDVETSANIAANRIQGQFDLDLLSQLTYELSQLEDKSLLTLTGQTDDEIQRLLKMSGVVEPGENETPPGSQQLHCPQCQYEGARNEFQTAQQPQA